MCIFLFHFFFFFFSLCTKYPNSRKLYLKIPLKTITISVRIIITGKIEYSNIVSNEKKIKLMNRESEVSSKVGLKPRLKFRRICYNNDVTSSIYRFHGNVFYYFIDCGTSRIFNWITMEILKKKSYFIISQLSRQCRITSIF